MIDTKVEQKVILRGKARAAYDALVEAKRVEAEAKKAKAEAEAILMEALGDEREAYIGKTLVLKVVAGRNTSFDREAMLAAYPEAYQACLKETTYDYLKVVY